MEKLKSSGGFSIKELMIIVVLIGGIALIALPAMRNVRTESQKIAISKNLETIAIAGKQYFTETGSKEPISFQELQKDYCMNLHPIAKESYTDLLLEHQGGTLMVKAKNFDVAYTYSYVD